MKWWVSLLSLWYQPSRFTRSELQTSSPMRPKRQKLFTEIIPTLISTNIYNDSCVCVYADSISVNSSGRSRAILFGAFFFKLLRNFISSNKTMALVFIHFFVVCVCVSHIYNIYKICIVFSFIF